MFEDNEVYEKWSQAVSSAHDLTDQAQQVGDGSPTVFTAIFPLLVVPNGTLWTVTFDSAGARTSGPEQADRCPFFLDNYVGTRDPFSTPYAISHLEFVTFGGLRRIVDALPNGFSAGEFEVRPVFPMNQIFAATRKK